MYLASHEALHLHTHRASTRPVIWAHFTPRRYALGARPPWYLDCLPVINLRTSITTRHTSCTIILLSSERHMSYCLLYTSVNKKVEQYQTITMDCKSQGEQRRAGRHTRPRHATPRTPDATLQIRARQGRERCAVGKREGGSSAHLRVCIMVSGSALRCSYCSRHFDGPVIRVGVE